MIKWSQIVEEPIIQEFTPLDNAVNGMTEHNKNIEDALHKFYDCKVFAGLDSKVCGTIGDTSMFTFKNH